MWPTMEVRWFGAGSVPAAVREWFGAGDRTPEHKPGRVDHYLHLPDINSLGIKLREGKIEVKKLHQGHGAVRLHERVMGVMEHWRKWSFLVAQSRAVGEAQPGGLADALAPPSAWIAVQKDRELLKYQVDDDERVLTVPTDQYARRGCYIELARVTTGRVFWSLALEAFGPESSLPETLLLVAQRVFARGNAPALEVDDSCSYPAWLHVLPAPQA